MCKWWALLVNFAAVQGLMFPPLPGRECSDNGECETRCCLMTSLRHRRPHGVCQPLPAIGDYCAPGDRLRDYSGWRVYTHSCPCSRGLDCQPAWQTRLIAFNVLQDPQCMPVNVSALELHARGYGRPPVGPPASVPGGSLGYGRADVRTPAPL